MVDVKAAGVDLKTPMGSIKGIPLSFLGWVMMGMMLMFLIWKMTGSFQDGLDTIAEHAVKQTVVLERIHAVLDK